MTESDAFMILYAVNRQEGLDCKLLSCSHSLLTPHTYYGQARLLAWTKSTEQSRVWCDHCYHFFTEWAQLLRGPNFFTILSSLALLGASVSRSHEPSPPSLRPALLLAGTCLVLDWSPSLAFLRHSLSFSLHVPSAWGFMVAKADPRPDNA
jgi:hypothetical protein